MKPKDWIVIIIMLVGMMVSVGGLALSTFETKDANRGQHALMIQMLQNIENKVTKLVH